MVRSYRKYEAAQSFGTVCTASSNCIWTRSARNDRSTSAGRAYVGANENVLCWDVKTGELLSTWHDSGNSSQVTCIVQCRVQPDLVAVGYADGSIRVWDALSEQVVVSFNGHRGAVTHLAFDRQGARLASGGNDTDIILWNLLSETAEFRLRGHRDQITGLSFLRPSRDTDDVVVEEEYLLSTAKDALIKVWDLANPHCMETHVAQTSGECWALGMTPDGSGCITAGNDGELTVWSLDFKALADADTSGVESERKKILTSRGVLRRQGKDRTVGVHFHPTQDCIAVHGTEKAVELWRIRSADEIHRHMQRKRRRRREKAVAAGEALLPEADDALGEAEIADVFVPHVIVRTGGKVRSIDWATSAARSRKSLQFLIATTNNQLESYTVTSTLAQQHLDNREPPDYTRSFSVELPGHRTDIRTLALSSDDRMLASASAGQLKVWNLQTRSCLRTLECGQALCSAFLPGDRIVLLGTKTGELELYDISTSTLIESLNAHDGHAIWTLAVHPDGKSVVTGSADKSAKFWRFDIIDEEIPGTRRTTQRLKLTQVRQLKVSDDILSLCFSPDQRLLTVSTLDNTVKVFFADTLKLFLTLYGHKLPVLNLSISCDSKLIATCSADKNVRVWGLDFGDCHKAFFAHQDSVMQVAFIPQPVEQEEKYILFSASKDGTVKSWDAQKFEQVQRLDGHHGEVWAMVLGRSGETVVTASHDKSIRVWEAGDDLVFLEEEREKELEEMYESTLAQNLDRDFRDEELQSEEVAATSKQTITTLTHGEKVVEALELAVVDREVMSAYERERTTNPKLAPPQRNPLFLALGNITAEKHVLNALSQIPTPALHDALFVIPFTTLSTLFAFLATFVEKRMRPELAWRVAYFLLQVHMRQIVASRQLSGVFEEILERYEAWLEEEKSVVGFNLAGLAVLGREAREGMDGWGGFVDGDGGEGGDADIEKGRKKRAFGRVA